MKQFNIYISEKLRINKNLKLNNDTLSANDFVEYLNNNGYGLRQSAGHWYHLVNQKTKEYPYIFVVKYDDHFYIDGINGTDDGFIKVNISDSGKSIKFEENKLGMDVITVKIYGVAKKQKAYEYTKNNADILISLLKKYE